MFISEHSVVESGGSQSALVTPRLAYLSALILDSRRSPLYNRSCKKKLLTTRAPET
jgi:hypothetical protein